MRPRPGTRFGRGAAGLNNPLSTDSSMMRLTLAMKRCLLVLLAAVIPAFASAQEAPDALVRRVTDEVLAAIKADKDAQTGNLQAVFRIADEKVLPHFDFTRMTRLALGRNWQQANEAQRAALTQEFRALLVRTYATSLSQYRNQKIEVKPVKAGAGDTDVIVRTQVLQSGGPPIPIDYSMEKQDKGWKVYDVAIDSVSLVTTYRGSFNDQIQKGGIDGLVKTLADRNKSGEAAKAGAKAEPKK